MGCVNWELVVQLLLTLGAWSFALGATIALVRMLWAA